MIRLFLCASVILTALLNSIERASAEEAKRPPNVVFFLIDDLGWMDLGCYGSRYYHTPNIDRLSEEGARLTSFYSSAPVCSPSRASCAALGPARVRSH